jgi:predicted adenylyl cyclase CyaB
MQNLELKAHYEDDQQAVKRAQALNINREWTRTQVDTYYIVSDGKLKLRQVDGQQAELISYKRPEKANAKVSDYRLYHSKSGDVLHQVLSHVHEVDTQVVKQRTLYLWENVRIHIDRVESLGNFIEFEAVMSEQDDIKISQQRIDFLIEHFDIQPEHFIDTGYYELLKKDQLHA